MSISCDTIIEWNLTKNLKKASHIHQNYPFACFYLTAEHILKEGINARFFNIWCDFNNTSYNYWWKWLLQWNVVICRLNHCFTSDVVLASLFTLKTKLNKTPPAHRHRFTWICVYTFSKLREQIFIILVLIQQIFQNSFINLYLLRTIRNTKCEITKNTLLGVFTKEINRFRFTLIPNKMHCNTTN